MKAREQIEQDIINLRESIFTKMMGIFLDPDKRQHTLDNSDIQPSLILSFLEGNFAQEEIIKYFDTSYKEARTIYAVWMQCQQDQSIIDDLAQLKPLLDKLKTAEKAAAAQLPLQNMLGACVVYAAAQVTDKSALEKSASDAVIKGLSNAADREKAIELAPLPESEKKQAQIWSYLQEAFNPDELVKNGFFIYDINGALEKNSNKLKEAHALWAVCKQCDYDWKIQKLKEIMMKLPEETGMEVISISDATRYLLDETSPIQKQKVLAGKLEQLYGVTVGPDNDASKDIEKSEIVAWLNSIKKADLIAYIYGDNEFLKHDVLEICKDLYECRNNPDENNNRDAILRVLAGVVKAEKEAREQHPAEIAKIARKCHAAADKLHSSPKSLYFAIASKLTALGTKLRKLFRQAEDKINTKQAAFFKNKTHHEKKENVHHQLSAKLESLKKSK